MLRPTFLLVCLGAFSTGADAPPPAAPPSQGPAGLRAVLNTTVPSCEFNTGRLADALNFLADRFNFSFVVDDGAFRSLGATNVEDVNVSLHRVSRLRVGTVLRLLLNQIGADFRQEDGVVVVLPLEFTLPEHQLRRPVDATFSRVPLRDACQQLSESTGVSILVDGRCGEESKLPVSAVLNQTPLDTAVRLLADMVDLRAVGIDNTLYVTSKANGGALQQEQEQAGPRPTYPMFGGPRAPGAAEPAKPAKPPQQKTGPPPSK